jgi:hypothetical protein
MKKSLPPAMIGLFCAALFLLLSSHAYSQKLMIPRMVPGGGDILQVEGENGQPIKINYAFNFHKDKVTRDGDTIYPLMHDEILYSAANGKLTINKNVYQVGGTGVETKKIVQKNIVIDINTVPEGSAKRNAIRNFISLVIQQSGIASKKGHSLAVLQVSSPVLANSIAQIENPTP